MSKSAETIPEMPYGLHELRADRRPLLVGAHRIRCHVKDCSEIVELPRGTQWKRMRTNCCQRHHIFVHKNTYRFDDTEMGWQRNFLATVRDTDRLKKIQGTKVEQRWGHENSEDALTWNVFRTFEKAGKLSLLAALLTGERVQMVEPIELIPWSNHNGSPWEPLEQARQHFKEGKRIPTEPDVVLLSRSGMVFVEAKFGSPNKRKEPDIYRYQVGGFYKQYFTADLASVSYHQLVRHFLFAAHIADQLGIRQFMLVNLVRRSSQQEPGNTSRHFGQGFLKKPNQFRQATWEDIYDAFLRSNDLPPELNLLRRYFENKTWNLQPAFDRTVMTSETSHSR